MKLAALFLSLMFLFSFATEGQTVKSIRGVVKDSAGAAIEAATVKIITAKDSISSTTDKKGQFKFENISATAFTLAISSAGFETFRTAHEFKKDQPVIELPPIILKVKIHELKEVVVKSVIVPVTVMEDTVEFDARAYIVRNGDVVEDLLKQLPGIDVDKDGNVKAEGKSMTKLRVNGRDFFTGDVTAYIKQLPANIISKLQVIDDYGDEANFTGIKTGEPNKMLNLVTKPGMNKGTFNSAMVSAGTHGVVSAGANSNLWRDSKQMSLNGNVSHSDNKSLVSNYSGASATYRDSWGKKLSFNASYNYNNSRNKSNSSTYSETIYPTGSLFTNADYASQGFSQGHHLQAGLNYNKDKSNYFTFQGSVGYNLGNNSNTGISRQKGLVAQDLQNSSYATQSSPSLSGNAFYSHRFKKAGRVVSVTLSMGATTNRSNQQLLDHTRYYDVNSSTLLKDSLLERLVESKNASTRSGISVSYSEPINKNNYVDFSYNYSSNTSNSSLLTNVSKSPGVYQFVDSLSNTYFNTFGNTSFAANYRHSAKGFNYTAGLQVQPNTILGDYAGRKESIRHTSTNFSPVASLRISLSKTSSAGINYSGQSTSPSINQLQPVVDTRNLQNIIVGNPDLKTSFSHRLALSYSTRPSKEGTMFTLAVNGSTIKNQVVTDLHLINDTATRSFRQETHFRNVNGNYNVGGNYNFVQPLFNRKLNLDASGGFGYSRTISFADNTENVGRTTQLSQSLRLNWYTRLLSLGGGVQYHNSKTDYTTGLNRNSVETWRYNLSTGISIFSKLSVGIDATKQLNKGYYQSIDNSPLYLNGHASLSFLKKQAASLHLQVNDLLNQGNIPVRMVTGNSITDTRSTNITHYFVLTFNMQLNKFAEEQ